MNTVASFCVRDLRVRHGRVDAVRGISFDLPVGSSVALVGHNGAGKTSALLAIGGCLPARACQGTFVERDSSSNDMRRLIGPSKACDVTLVPERDKVFNLLTVHENLVAADRVKSATVRLDDIYNFFPRLAERRKTLAGNLSGGEQQMLAIGSALLGTPRLLLLDEPTHGLSVPIIESICSKMTALRAQLGLTLLVALAETAWVSEFAESALVLDRGELASRPILTHPGVHETLERLLTGSTASADPFAVITAAIDA